MRKLKVSTVNYWYICINLSETQVIVSYRLLWVTCSCVTWCCELHALLLQAVVSYMLLWITSCVTGCCELHLVLQAVVIYRVLWVRLLSSGFGLFSCELQDELWFHTSYRLLCVSGSTEVQATSVVRDINGRYEATSCMVVAYRL